MAQNDNSQPIIPGSSHLNEVPDPKDTKHEGTPNQAAVSTNPSAKPVSWGEVMHDNNPGALPSTGNPNKPATEWGNMDDQPQLAQAEEIPMPAAAAAPIPMVAPLASQINPNLDSPMSAPISDIAPASVLTPNLPVTPAPTKKVGKGRKLPISLYIILFLLVVVLGLTSLVIYLLTGGAANVNLVVDNQNSSSQSTITSSSSSSSTTTTSTTSSTASATQTDIVFYLLAYGSDNIGGVVDPNSIPKDSIKFGQEDYLVPVVYKQKFQTANPVEEALKGLFAIKSSSYGSDGYKTTTYLSDVQPKVTVLPNGKTQVNLVGSIVFAGDLSPIYFQAQVEQTIKKYTKDYVVQVNGSEQEYKCLANQSGQCSSSTTNSSSN